MDRSKRNATPSTRRKPSAGDIVEFAVDQLPPEGIARRHFRDFNVNQAELFELIGNYQVISEDRWDTNYCHIAGNDCTGVIRLKDSTVIRWLVRPGGLANLDYGNGGFMYLGQ